MNLANNKKSLATLLFLTTLALSLPGCISGKTVSREQLQEIVKQERNQVMIETVQDAYNLPDKGYGRPRPTYSFYYTGTKDEYDYFKSQSGRKTPKWYRVPSSEIEIDDRFALTMNSRQWINGESLKQFKPHKISDSGKYYLGVNEYYFPYANATELQDPNQKYQGWHFLDEKTLDWPIDVPLEFLPPDSPDPAREIQLMMGFTNARWIATEATLSPYEELKQKGRQLTAMIDEIEQLQPGSAQYEVKAQAASRLAVELVINLQNAKQPNH